MLTYSMFKWEKKGCNANGRGILLLSGGEGEAVGGKNVLS